LSFCQIIINQSGSDAIEIINISLGGATSAQCSNSSTMTLSAGEVINYTIRVNDTSNRFTTNDTIITVTEVDTTPPIVNVTLNKSLTTIRINDVINVTANATDTGDGLAFGFIGHNMSGALINYTFTLSGGAAEFSQNFTINLTRGNVINFSVVVNDSADPANQALNDTIITVANTPATQASIVYPPNDFKTNLQPLDLNITFLADPDNDVINITYYIDGVINQTQLGNTTFNASDGVYILNVSLHDNVTTLEYSANVTINFTVDTVAPNVTLISPKNDTVDTDGNISFSYNVTDTFSIGNCSLIINQKINQTNRSIINGTRQYFNLTSLQSLQYNWSVNCSDSADNIGSSEERTVTVVLFENFNGTTTNLSNVDIRNITNFSIENTAAGRINFTEAIDLSSGGDLDKYVNISFNRIEINSTALPALNKSAILHLYGLTFSKPRILRDGSVCPSSICEKLSFTDGNLTFNVTHFSVYSAEETPSDTTTTTTTTTTGGGVGGGGGGGRSNFSLKREFTVDKDLIKEKILQGETITTELKIKNSGQIKLQLSVEVENLDEFIALSEDTFELATGESKIITIAITASENEVPEVYTGKIVVKSGTLEENIITIIEVIERQALFDISVLVDKNYKKVLKAQEVKIDIDLTNLGTLRPADVELYYAIKDLDENVIVFKTESLAVNDKLTVSRSLQIPDDLEEGKYIVYARVTYNDKIAASSDLFEVVDILPGLSRIDAIKIIGTIVLALVLLLLIINSFYYSDLLKGRHKEPLQRKVPGLFTRRRLITWPKERIIGPQIVLGKARERVLETKRGLQTVLEKPQERVSKAMEKFKELQKPGLKQIEDILTGKEIEKRRILRLIEEWKNKGYDTTLLELEVKALENKEIGAQIRRIKEWKSKGYDTTILELEAKALEDKKLAKQIKKIKEWKKKGYNTFMLEEKIKSSYKNRNSYLEAREIEIKIQEWKNKGYNTTTLEEKLRRLKNR